MLNPISHVLLNQKVKEIQIPTTNFYPLNIEPLNIEPLNFELWGLNFELYDMNYEFL